MQYYSLYFSLIYVLIYDELESKKDMVILRSMIGSGPHTFTFTYAPMWHHPIIGGGGDQVWSSDAVLVVPTPTPCSAYVKGEADKKETRARITGLHLHDT
jgi:hypothetical protein